MPGTSNRIRALFALAFIICLFTPVRSIADVWADYENTSAGGLSGWSGYSTDPRVESRRTDHFLIRYGHEPQIGILVEQIAQGHLQYLENCYDIWLSLGFTPGLGGSGTTRYKSILHTAKTFPGDTTGPVVATGFTEGPYSVSGMSVTADYLAYRDQNGATPHEFGHGWRTNQPGFSESVANWIEQQAITTYPGDWPSVGMTIAHEANYYNNLSPFNYFMEAPGYGAPFLMKVFYDANQNPDDLVRKMIRSDTSGAVDKKGAIYDGLGLMNAKMLDMDFWNKRFNNYDSGTKLRTYRYDMDTTRQGYHYNRIPMVRQPGVTGVWYRPEFSMIPQTLSNNYIPLTVTATGSPRTVSCDFRPVPDAVRGTGFRACFVAFNSNKEPRYSAVWNAGVKSFTLADDENTAYLAIVACPAAMQSDLMHNEYTVDNVGMFPYRVSLTGASPKGWQWPAPAAGSYRIQTNGGGKVANTATVASSVYVGPNAMVMGSAKAYGNARIEDYAYVDGSAVIGRSGTTDDPVISGNAYVTGTSQVYGHGKVRDYGLLLNASKVYENGIVSSHSTVDGAQVFGNAVLNQTAERDTGLCFKGSYSGCAIFGGDAYANGTFTAGVSCVLHNIAVSDNAYQFIGYNFEKKSCIFAMDQYGINHAYLMGEPQLVTDTVNSVTTTALNLDGSTQYAELRQDAVDFPDLTIAGWVKWNGTANDQIIFSCGDGSTKYVSLTPKAAATGFLQFAICDGTNTQYLNASAALTNAWAHVAVTLSGDTGTLYINGSQVAQNTSMTINPDNLHTEGVANANYIGRNNDGNYFAGRIDEFKVLNKALSAAEVLTLKGVVTSGSAGGSDTTPPTPTTATWLVVPSVRSNGSITMSATLGTDAGGNGVLYYFRCVNDSTHDSGWISENKYTDCNCSSGVTYTYAVRMKDKKGNTGTESTQQGATAPAADVSAPTPDPPTFSSIPKGISTTAISMTATKAVDDDETVLYRFTRVQSPSATSGWTSSRTWTDTGLTSGSSYSYTLEVKDGHGNTTATTTSAMTVARDDTAPLMEADFRLHWRMLPVTQLDKTVRMVVQEPIETAVDYYFECVETPAINSGWTSSREWVTPAFASDGTYSFHFKMRDRSPQLNQSGWSLTKTAKVTTTNSYHSYVMSDLAALPKSTLVQFSGKVTQVNPDNYVVTSSDGLTSITVVPRSYYCATDPMLLNRNVDVKGHLWTYTSTGKRVTGAFVRGNPQSGKVEFENCEYSDSYWALKTNAGAYGLEYLGGYPSGYSITIPNVAATSQMTVRYRGSGTISLYVNGTHNRNLSFANQSNWTTVVFTGLTIPAGATLNFQRDSGDASIDLDYATVGPVYAVSGKVTSTVGGAGISGATVYFSVTSNATTNPLALTATTDSSGNYSFNTSEGTWYVAAAKTGYNASADQTVTVNGAAVSNVNFALVPNVAVTGKITDKNSGANISGASVFFAPSPGGVPAYTTTTNTTGDFSQSIPNGTYYVHAGKTGYYPSLEQVLVVNSAAIASYNFQLEVNTKPIPQTASLYFSVDPDSFTAAEGANAGNWQLQYLDGVNVSGDSTKNASAGPSPTVDVRGAIRWEHNSYDDGDGFEVQDRQLTPVLPFNGGTFVAVIKPALRTVDMSYGGQYIFEIGYNGAKGFSIIMLNDTGQIRIRRNGTNYDTGVFIPDGKKTVLACVVQPNGSFILYSNGRQVYSQSATSSFVNIDLSSNAWFQKKVGIGKGFLWYDGGACYNGDIGDVLVYYAPLNTTDRARLETHLMKKFAIGGNTITASAGAGGTIAPSGSVPVVSGGSQTFTITPAEGYAISTVLVDGVNNAAAVSSGSYTFTNVLADHTISATFVSTQTFTITASAGTGGSISPSGAVSVVNGGNQTFSISANAGYAVSQVTVDGVSQGAISTYTFSNVVSDHTISATFGPYTGPTPVALYEFENNVNDSVGTNNGTAYGTPTYVTGKLGAYAIQFNGSNQYVSIARPVQDDFTIAFWVKTTQASNTGTNWYNGYGLVDGEVGGVTDDFGITYLNSKVAFGVGNPDTTFFSTSTINTGNWVHVACTRSASTGEMKIYINGTLQTTGTGPTGTKSSPGVLRFGSIQTNYNFLNGAMDRVKIFDTVLTASEVSSLANEGATFAIISSAGDGGSISPSGTTTLGYGSNQTYTITPDIGYAVSEVTVDGASQGPRTTYTFSNVTANHTISATFSANFVDIADLAALKTKVGQLVRLTSSTVTFAPTTGARTTDYFFVGDSEAQDCVKVVDNKACAVAYGDGVQGLIGLVSQTVRGEYVLTVINAVTGTASTKIPAVGMNTMSAQLDLNVPAVLVRTWGRVTVSGGAYTLDDGYNTPLQVEPCGLTMPADGSFAAVSGVLWVNDDGTRVLLQGFAP